jgi:hypothetical protein
MFTMYGILQKIPKTWQKIAMGMSMRESTSSILAVSPSVL